MPGHIQNIHVESQSHEDDTTDEHGNPDEEEVTYRCQWKGCKVFNKPSSSLSWLRNHVVVHSGSKPLCCIFDGCGERFKSRIRLQQHVSKHLKAAAAAEASKNISQPSGSTTNSGTSTPSKSQRRKKQKRRGTAKGKTTGANGYRDFILTLIIAYFDKIFNNKANNQFSRFKLITNTFSVECHGDHTKHTFMSISHDHLRVDG